MPEATPQPPPRPSWENDWAPDTSRPPGTRRLWLAGTLAIATTVACVTAIAVSHSAPDRTSARPQAGSALDQGPGLLSFASPTTGPATPGKDETGTPTTSPTESVVSATASAATPASTAKTSPSGTKPTKSAPSAGSSGGSGGGPGGGSAPRSSALRSVRSVNYPDRYWHVSGGYVRLDPVGGSEFREDSTFTVVKGLADGSCYSFRAADGRYLRHRDFVLRADRDDGTSLFGRDATFCARASAHSGAVMLESVNYPGRYLRHQSFQLKLNPYQDSDLYRADSAFRLVDPLA
ncbi:AbfB domain-containing protein [Streptomyces sp. NPDC001068]|uniref:AbfB domain-containing protein n=1 Tax=Streptomyces sp. NPDC001068 TaxID=3364544 RepID=UPI00367EF974